LRDAAGSPRSQQLLKKTPGRSNLLSSSPLAPPVSASAGSCPAPHACLPSRQRRPSFRSSSVATGAGMASLRLLEDAKTSAEESYEESSRLLVHYPPVPPGPPANRNTTLCSNTHLNAPAAAAPPRRSWRGALSSSQGSMTAPSLLELSELVYAMADANQRLIDSAEDALAADPVHPARQTARSRPRATRAGAAACATCSPPCAARPQPRRPRRAALPARVPARRRSPTGVCCMEVERTAPLT